MHSLPIVILAAGQNSRFFPLNTDYHKGFTPLLGKPLVMHQLENLHQHGFRNVILVVSPRDNRPEYVKQLVAQHGLDDLELTLMEQPEARGMGDALLLAAQSIQDQFVVVFPYHLTAGELVSAMLDQGKQACVSVVETDKPWLYGIVKAEGGIAKGLIEKPAKGSVPSHLKVQGIYLLNRNFLTILKSLPQSEYAFETALDQLMQTDTVALHQLDQALPTLKYPWDLFTIQKILLSNQQSRIDPQAKVATTAVLDDSKGSIIIDAGATVSHAARIVGPSYIGKNAFVGDFSLIRESNLEEKVSIGVHADITRSIFLPGSTFHGGGFIGDSFIGEQVKIGAGCITANKRLDRQTITTLVAAKKVDVGYNALGAMIGSHARLGIRVSTMPGVCIGSHQVIKPGEIVSKNLPHASQT